VDAGAISTSGTTVAGFKKWAMTKSPGDAVASARASGRMLEVFDAKIAPGATAPMRRYSSRLASSSSAMASNTMAEPVTASSNDGAACTPRRAATEAARSASASKTVTRCVGPTSTSAIPAPMSPHPTTVILVSMISPCCLGAATGELHGGLYQTSTVGGRRVANIEVSHQAGARKVVPMALDAQSARVPVVGSPAGGKRDLIRGSLDELGLESE